MWLARKAAREAEKGQGQDEAIRQREYPAKSLYLSPPRGLWLVDGPSVEHYGPGDLKASMNTQSNSASPNSDSPNSLGITGDSKPNVPVFACIVYVHKKEDGTVIGRVANLVGGDSCDIRASGNSERDVLGKVTREFKSLVFSMFGEGQKIPWVDPPQPPLENEQVRSVPVHLWTSSRQFEKQLERRPRGNRRYAYGKERLQMGQLDDVGEADGWRCWLCDEPVDRDMPSSDPRSASVDTRLTKARAKKKRKQDKQGLPPQRLAHKGCNTGKGAIDPVVAWPDQLIVVDPAPIIAAAARLERKGGREAMARCPTQEDAEETAVWLVDRMSRLAPDLAVNRQITSTGGQYLVSLYT
jgi:hypothetical protein